MQLEPAKKTRIKISRNPLSFRPRSKKVKIVIDGDDPTMGTVGLTICEIPKGLFRDFKDDVESSSDALTASSEEELRLRVEMTAALKAAKERGAGPEELFTVKQQLKAALDVELVELRKDRKKASAEQAAAQLGIIRWGVCDHVSDDFELDDLVDDEVDTFPFQRGQENYDGVNYLVAGDQVISAYQSIGQPFLDALYFAIIAWQEGKHNPPEKVWEGARRFKEIVTKAAATAVKKSLEANGLTVDELDAEELAGVEVGGDADRPLAEDRSLTTS